MLPRRQRRGGGGLAIDVGIVVSESHIHMDGLGQAMEYVKWSHPIVMGVLRARYSLYMHGCPVDIRGPF